MFLGPPESAGASLLLFLKWGVTGDPGAIANEYRLQGCLMGL